MSYAAPAWHGMAWHLPSSPSRHHRANRLVRRYPTSAVDKRGSACLPACHSNPGCLHLESELHWWWPGAEGGCGTRGAHTGNLKCDQAHAGKAHLARGFPRLAHGAYNKSRRRTCLQIQNSTQQQCHRRSPSTPSVRVACQRFPKPLRQSITWSSDSGPNGLVAPVCQVSIR